MLIYTYLPFGLVKDLSRLVGYRTGIPDRRFPLYEFGTDTRDHIVKCRTGAPMGRVIHVCNFRRAPTGTKQQP
jgi:hypothetical protein